MSYNISEKQINEFKEAFSLYDPQNLGALPITELGFSFRYSYFAVYIITPFNKIF
jgi:Ca2+-binding EF-hand superfamily protein